MSSDVNSSDRVEHCREGHGAGDRQGVRCVAYAVSCRVQGARRVCGVPACHSATPAGRLGIYHIPALLACFCAADVMCGRDQCSAGPIIQATHTGAKVTAGC